jgi:predicted negative regulator of RcsB-dependent stress response
MNGKQNTFSKWIVIGAILGLGVMVGIQQNQIRLLKARMNNMLSYNLPIDNIVDLEKRVELNAQSLQSLTDHFLNMN